MAKYSPADLNPSFFSQFSNDPSNMFAWKMDAVLESAYGSKLENIPQGDFEAVVLSGFRTGESTGTGTDPFDARIVTMPITLEKYLEVKVRPIGIGTGNMLPAPTESDLTPEQRRNIIGMHEWARSDFTVESLEGAISCGAVVKCYYKYGSVRNSSFTGLRFKTPAVSTNPSAGMLLLEVAAGSASDWFNGAISTMGALMIGSPPPPDGIVSDPGPFIESFKKAFQKKGYEWDENYNIIGVRSPGGVDTFNDFVFLCVKRETEWEVRKFVAITKPGLKVLKNPLKYNSAGTGAAILVPNQYKHTWKIGIHGLKKNDDGTIKSPGHTALKQRGGGVDLYRDNNKDDVHDYVGLVRDQWKGINLHRASNRVVTKVGWYSAGCQVFQVKENFETFMGIVASLKDFAKNKTYYTYTLLQDSDL